MNRLTLLLRNLWHFRGVNLAVVAGMAVATAVLTGALMVGDSVRGSLADLALRRLGPVDQALVSTRFFPQSLADDLGVVPGVIIRGGASNSSNGRRTADVQIAAIGGQKVGHPPFDFADFPPPRAGCVINSELARELGVDHEG